MKTTLPFVVGLVMGFLAGAYTVSFLAYTFPPEWAEHEIEINTLDRKCRGYAAPDGRVWICNDGWVEFNKVKERMPSYE